MRQETLQRPRVRVANFSEVDFPCDHRLDFNSDDIDDIASKIRRYADLPYVWVVAGVKAGLVPGLLSALKAIRSPCYPYALFSIDGTQPHANGGQVDIVKLDAADVQNIQKHIDRYAASRFRFNLNRLKIGRSDTPPDVTEVAIVGGGITGLYAAGRLAEAGIEACLVEKTDKLGGIWSQYANSTSQVNSSECAYRLFEKNARSNRDHTGTWEILEDIAQLAERVSDRIFLETEVKGIEKTQAGYQLKLSRGGRSSILKAKGVILAVNDRVGKPREVLWPNQSDFKGEITSGISDDTGKIDWRNKNVIIVGMGAFAVENVRTALEGGAKHVTVLCRRHGTVCPKIIDYLNFTTPYDDAFKHDGKSNLKNMVYWKKLYALSGATQPECWMGKIKHDGHTISVSDIWFIGHYLKKIETITGSIAAMTETGVVLTDGHRIDADVVINCIGFERNASLAAKLSGYSEMYNNNFLDNDFVYLADAFIDGDAFNSLFGSSVLEMVKFYVEVFLRFFDNPEYHHMINTQGIERIPIEQRNWSQYIQAAMALIQSYPEIRAIANRQVNRRTNNFLEVHDLNTYVTANKREWIDMHAMLAGRVMKAEECLPYVFEKLVE